MEINFWEWSLKRIVWNLLRSTLLWWSLKLIVLSVELTSCHFSGVEPKTYTRTTQCGTYFVPLLWGGA